MTSSIPLPNDIPSLQALVRQLQQQLAACPQQPGATIPEATPADEALAAWQEQNRQLRRQLADSTRVYEQQLAEVQHQHVTLQAEHAALQRDLAGASQPALPDNLEQAQARIRQLSALLHSLERENYHLLYRLRRALRRLYGRSSERLDPNQPLLFPDVMLPPPPATESDATATPSKPKRKAKPHGRRRLPEHLERQLCVLDLPAEQRCCPCCQSALRDIGVDITEQLEIEPLRFYVLRYEQHKYICPHCNGREDLAAAAAATPLPADPIPAAAPPVETTPASDADPAAPLAEAATALALAVEAAPPAASTPALPVAALAACMLAATSAALTEAAGTATRTVAVPAAAHGDVLPAAAAAVALCFSDTQLSLPDTVPPAGPERPPGPEPPPGPKGSPAGFEPRGIYTVPKPKRGLPGCLAGTTLLAWVIVQKFADYVPLHRLSRILTRSGVYVPATTLGDWVAGCADLLQPLYELMHERLRDGALLFADESPVRVLDQSAPKHIRQGYFWVYVGDQHGPYSLFDYRPNRSGDGPQEFLAGYQGFIHADAYDGYNDLFGPEYERWLACWAHGRRNFEELSRLDPVALEAVQRIGPLYKIEARAKEQFAAAQAAGQTQTLAEIRLALRQREAVPLLATLHTWLTERRAGLTPKEPLLAALNYVLNHWPAFCRYTSNGHFEIDNNVAERTLRVLALGRNNWLFLGNDGAGRRAAVLLSLVATCQRHGVDPLAYCKDVLTRLPTLPPERRAELLPDAWQRQAAQGV